MFSRPVKEINAEYKADEKFLPSIQTLVREACINAGLSRKDVHAVTLAIEEGVSNIIRHAYLYEKGIIRIRIVIYRKRIVFSLMDNGRSFQPDGSGKLDLTKLVESARKGGLGFYMINKIMDSVEYFSSPGLNELRMTRLISRQPERARLFLGRMFTLRVKFSLYTFMIMLTIIAGAYIFIDTRTTDTVYEHLDDIVASLSKTVSDQAALHIINRRSDVEFDELVYSYIKANPELIRIVLTDTVGMILADSRDIRNLRKQYSPPPGVQVSRVGFPQTLSGDSDATDFLVSPIINQNITIGYVYMSYTNRQLNKIINTERRKVIWLTIIGLAVGIGGIYLLSNYFVSPIVRITQRVRKFSSGDIETELPLEGVEEFFEISKALNEMMSRLRRDRDNIIERERIAKEIEVASQIQKTLLPGELPEIPSLELHAFYRAAYHVGGDLYDIFKIDEKHYCLLVADVSGKGIPASLVMSMLRTIIRIVAHGKKSAHDILISVNEYIRSDIPPGIFITIFLGVYNIGTQKLNFVSAGHNPVVFYRKQEKKTSLINPAGLPLGMPIEKDRFASKLSQQEIKIERGDVLFIYSDGITESMNRSGHKYGIERLQEFFEEQIAGNSDKSPSAITELILADIDRHSGAAVQNDDITFIIISSAPEEKAEIETKRVT
ncbi:MAG: SpoIIE family protein phosphatase [Candidatus Zixiibacteriota bacterium]|nr:MAG: SpoIIE family protein phosphatase [candidate division Zixibacteria bacterium]